MQFDLLQTTSKLEFAACPGVHSNLALTHFNLDDLSELFLHTVLPHMTAL